MKNSKEHIGIIILFIFCISACNENQFVSLQKSDEEIKEKNTEVSLFRKGEIKDKKTAELEEELRTLSKNMNETATLYAQLYRRHDKQYYLDRMKEITAKCVRGKELDSTCLKNGLEQLKSE